MRDLVDLQQFKQHHAGETLVLCTLVHKEHFGYRAVGAKKLITRSGASCGLLSGGCLEGEIVRIALEHWDALPFTRAFSTMDEADRLFGYQTGCPGVITILFELMPADAPTNLYLPFGSKPVAAGVKVVLNDATGTHRTHSPAFASSDTLFFDPWVTPVTLYIVGCGPDAVALTDLAAPLGWTVCLLDYRAADRLAPPLAHAAQIMPVDTLAQAIRPGPMSAVVVMTHNYEADLAILRQLIGRNIDVGYVGCLGPRRRYEQLKEDLRRLHHLEITPADERRVHAPTGLFTSGRSPTDIALSTLAQIQSIVRAPNHHAL